MNQDSNQSQAPLYFDCHMCGECCSSWNIPIETEKARQLLERPWVQARLTETRRALTPMTAETYRIPLTDENMCVFLADDRRCMVEIHEGLTLKPHECQRFPFATVRLPNGTDWHETSAACKSISEKLLLAFQPIQPRQERMNQPQTVASQDPKLEASGDLWSFPDELLQANHEQAASLEPVALLPERIPLLGFKSLSAAQYATYQNALKRIFQSTTHPEAALFQAAACLRECTASKRPQNNSGEGASRGFTNTMGSRRFAQSMGGLLTLLFLRKPYRTLSSVQLILGRDYTDPRLFGEPIALRAQSRIPWNSELNLHLNAFLFNLLQRKRLLALGSSLSAQLAMAGMACLLVQWYARALASLASLDQLGEKELTTAIRLVERYYTGHQPRFIQWFSCRWRGAISYRLLFEVFWGSNPANSS